MNHIKDKTIIVTGGFGFIGQHVVEKLLKLKAKRIIILDSLDWSGFNTSLDALSLDKPIITLPSKFMRGRHTYGILKILKIDENITEKTDGPPSKLYLDL